MSYRVEHRDTEVQKALVERDAHFGPLGGLGPFVGQPLLERADRLDRPPEGLVESAVDLRSLGDERRASDRGIGIGGRLLRERGLRGEKAERHDQRAHPAFFRICSIIGPSASAMAR